MLISMHVIVSYFVEVGCRLSMLLVVSKETSSALEDTLKQDSMPLGGLTKQNPLKFTIALCEYSCVVFFGPW